MLKGTKGIDPNRIFVIGHSLGGTLVPRIAQADSSICGFIIMAGAARPLEEILPEQMAYVFSSDGSITKEEKDQIDKVKEQASKIKSPDLSENDAPILGAPPSYWLDLRNYEPAEEALNIKQPILIIQGGRDYQVKPDWDFAIWKKSLSSRKDVRFICYPNLNHLFIAGTGVSTPEEYNKTGNIDETVITDIANWILKN